MLDLFGEVECFGLPLLISPIYDVGEELEAGRATNLATSY
jgi:hypothetical protein